MVPAGRVDTTSVLTGVDIMPTLLAATGVPEQENYRSDGLNVLSAFQGRPLKRETPIFWEWRGPHAQTADWPTHAVRDGDFTLIQDEKAARTELFNVIADRAQQHDISAANPNVVASLRAKLEAWRRTLPPFTQSPARGGSRSRPATPATDPKAATQDRAAIFKRWDKNGDGALTLEEYTAAIRTKDTAPARFRAFDGDGNGSLSSAEFERAR
jgi:arylsulfatase A-like enzyme